MDRIVVGLDIGTTKIACFIGRRGKNPKKVQILGFGACASNGVRYGVVESLDETAKSIKKAVEDASMMANVDVTEVYIGVAGMHIHSSPQEASIPIPPNEFQTISKNDIENLTNVLKSTATIDDAEEIIHIFPQTFYVDGRELSPEISPVGVSGKVLKGTFNVVTGNCKEIRKLVNSVAMAGYEVKDIILEPVASAYAVLNENDIHDGVALVDIGGGTTDIAVLMDDSVRFTSVLAIAGRVITNDISKECQIIPKYAEKLKVGHGTCLPSAADPNIHISIPQSHGQPAREISLRTLAEIIKPRVSMIFDLVTAELKDSNFIGHLINGIALTGGGANMQNIRDIAMLHTGVHCHIGKPDLHLEPIDDGNDAQLQMRTYSNSMYATSIGLVIYGLMEEEREEALRKQAEAADSKVAEEEALPEEKQKPEENTNNPNNPGPIPDPKPRFYDDFKKWIKRTFIEPIDE